jgi:hypothetical protein
MSKADQTMKQLKKELQAKIDDGVAASRAEAKGLAKALRAKSPVDTGALRDSIKVVNTPEGAKVTIGGGVVDYADDVEREEPFIAPTVQAFRSGYEASLRKAVE